MLAPLWLRHVVGNLLVLPQLAGRFGPFPAAHVRTNGFVVERDLMRTLERTPIRRKSDAFVVEGGKRSITRQIEELGLRPLLAGADGRAYDVPDWARSGMFWQRDQENVLLEDNQTRSTGTPTSSCDLLLATFAWGTRRRRAPDAASGRCRSQCVSSPIVITARKTQPTASIIWTVFAPSWAAVSASR